MIPHPPVVELPEGYTARPASMDDADAVTNLIAACELEDDGQAEIDPGDVPSAWGRPSFDPHIDAVIVEHEDKTIGWAEVFNRRRAEADVHPNHRGGGVGSALLAWTERRVLGSAGTLIGQTITDANAGAAELFRGAGYAPLWTSWILEVALDRDPDPVEAPRDVRLRAFEPGRDEHETYRVIEDAFSEWPDREPETFENWSSWVLGHEAFSPARSRLAVDGDRVIGAALAFDYGAENEGWVQQLAVDREYRNRGIARALLTEVFHAFRGRGTSACGLSTDSRTGALGLYERVGMRVRRSYTHWAKTLPRNS